MKLKEILNRIILNRIITEGVDDPGIFKCVFMAGGPGCFVADTLVRTQSGYEKIQNIQTGTMVYTINETTGDEELKPVVLTHEYTDHTEDLLELEFEGGVVVRCTENHEFYVDGKWIAAKDLVVGN
jgi:hypothetical protein